MIIIIYSVCPIFTNPVDWLKTLSNGVKTHLLKLKTSKFSQDPTGACWGKNYWDAQYIPLPWKTSSTKIRLSNPPQQLPTSYQPGQIHHRKMSDSQQEQHTKCHIFNCPAKPTNLTPQDLWDDQTEAAAFIGLTSHHLSTPSHTDRLKK